MDGAVHFDDGHDLKRQAELISDADPNWKAPPVEWPTVMSISST